MDKLKKIIVRFANSKVAENGMWMYGLQVFNTIIPLMTLPFVTRILGSAGFGVFSISLNIFGYFQTIVEYGFGMSATREIALLAVDTSNNEKKNTLFTSVLSSRAVLTVICFLISFVYVCMHQFTSMQSLSLMILNLGLLGSCVQMNWLYQGMQEMKYLSLVNMISRVLSVALIFTLIRSKEDILLYCLLYAISPFLSGLFGLVIAFKKFKVHFVRIGWNDIKKQLHIGWYVFTTQLSAKVFGAIGITFLGMFATKQAVGTFSAIQKIPTVLMLGWTPISQIIYPIVSLRMKSSFYDGKKFTYKVRKLVLPIFALGTVLLMIFSHLLISIAFGPEYAKYSIWLIPLLLWVLVSINNNFLGIQILLGSGHDAEYSKCFQIGVAITILLNLSLTFFFGGLGASLAPLLSELALMGLLGREVHRLDTV
jgi:PST family polysaccharide transporter